MKTVWIVRIGYDVYVYEHELAARRKYDKERKWYKDCSISENVLIQ